MKTVVICVLVVGAWLVSVQAQAQLGILSVCDYDPPESRIRDLTLQGWFNWSDGASAGAEDRTLSARLVVDYEQLFSSAAQGRDVDGHAQLRRTDEAWTAELNASGSVRSTLTDALFAVGALGLDASLDGGIEMDATGGVGTGRFRDATPLAQAIAIQNALLDIGQLLAPLGCDVLIELAQILGEVGPTEDEKMIHFAERLLATELLAEEQLGVRGLLAMEEILRSPYQTRLSGRDAQVRVGVSARLSTEPSFMATGIAAVRFAAVPDPVSQVALAAQAKLRLFRPSELGADADLTYTRSLPGRWTARGNYHLSIDRGWTNRDVMAISHLLSGSLTTQVLGAIGLSLAAEAGYDSGDEELSVSVSVHLEASLF